MMILPKSVGLISGQVVDVMRSSVYTASSTALCFSGGPVSACVAWRVDFL